MAQEHFIHGKVDSAHHEGRASTVRREQEANFQLQDYNEGHDLPAAEQWFIDQFGVPFGWAVGMSKIESDVGKHWKGLLDHLNGELDNEIKEE